MKNRVLAIFIRVIFMILLFGISIYFFQEDLFFTPLFFVFAGTIGVFELYFFTKKTFDVFEQTIDAILNNDFSISYENNNSKSKSFNKLTQLYENLKKSQHDQYSKELVYTSILNNVESSILIISKNEEWDVFLMNDYFSKLFNVPKLSKWKYLKNHLSDLCQFIEDKDFSEFKTTLEIQIEETEKQTYIVQSSVTKAFDKEYFVIILDSIQKVIDRKEKDAWINLMRIISHELMNSLTPIKSLTQNLNEIVHQEKISDEDLEDIKTSASTILSRGNQLQSFVESYRKLAMLPSPVKDTVCINDLFFNLEKLFDERFKNDGISFKFNANKTFTVLADKNQLEQVFVNLIINSINAIQKLEIKSININIIEKEERILIQFLDSGHGIDKSIVDKIFMPFYTTRKNGEGIGLTLSKNIIEAHGGYLKYNPIQGQTCFEIWM